MSATGSDDDRAMMRRCIALAATSVKAGEYPFAAVIARNGVFVCESINRAKQDRDVNSHAEFLAVSQAQIRERHALSECTIYATVEPCALCAYAIREAGIGRVVYGLRSPLMGGHSRWDVLSDNGLSNKLPEVFMPAPEILPGFLQDEIETLFTNWNPLIWRVIKARGIFVDCPHDRTTIAAARRGGFARRLTNALRAFLIAQIRRI